MVDSGIKLPEVSNDWKLQQLDGCFVAHRKWIGGLIPVLYHKTITANADWHLWLRPWLRGQGWMSLENKLPFNPEKSILQSRGEADVRLRKMHLFSLILEFISPTKFQWPQNCCLKSNRKYKSSGKVYARLITHHSSLIAFQKHARFQPVKSCCAKCCADAVPDSPISELLPIQTNGTDVGGKKQHY